MYMYIPLEINSNYVLCNNLGQILKFTNKYPMVNYYFKFYISIHTWGMSCPEENLNVVTTFSASFLALLKPNENSMISAIIA